MRTLTTALVLAIASAVALAADIGDKAPPLSVQKWAFGVPAQPNAGDGKNICVVSFIDATSAEGRRVAGVLTKLQEKYRSQNVAVVAVMPAETDAAEYVTAQKPRFSIALDKQEATQSAYIPPMSELPYSFVVGKDGVILWSGRSLITLTRTVEQVAAGKYDLAQARPLAQLRKDLQKCLQEEDSLKTLAVLDKMMAIEPDNYQHVAAKVDVLRFREDIAAARKARSDSLAAMAGSMRLTRKAGSSAASITVSRMKAVPAPISRRKDPRSGNRNGIPTDDVM